MFANNDALVLLFVDMNFVVLPYAVVFGRLLSLSVVVVVATLQFLLLFYCLPPSFLHSFILSYYFFGSYSFRFECAQNVEHSKKICFVFVFLHSFTSMFILACVFSYNFVLVELNCK